MRLRVAGTGHYLPPKVLTNVDLAGMVETSDEWIRSRTGIRERRILEDGVAPYTMGVAAAREALSAAGVPSGGIDLVIVATNVPEQPIPGTAPFVVRALSPDHEPPFFDIKAGCAGFVYGVALAGAAISSGIAGRVLLIGIEALSRFVDWNDRKTCVLFGDGAGAVVLEGTEEERGILGSSLHGDATKAGILRIEAGGVGVPASEETVRKGLHFLKMEGRGVFHAAVQMMERSTREALEAAGIPIQEVDWLVPHQANLRIIDSLVRRLGFPKERVLVNIDRVANTSTASIPILLDEAVRGGKIRDGDIVALTAFGAGACYGTVILRW